MPGVNLKALYDDQKDIRDTIPAVDRVKVDGDGEFPPEAIAWVDSVPWRGPELVPLDSIDQTNKGNWVASHEPEKVAGFVDSLERDGELRPVVLYETPDGMTHIADGHHRVLAYEQAGQDVLAFVAEVPTDDGPWADMHSQQNVDDGPASGPGPGSRPGASMSSWAKRATEPGE